jgi:predicted secreted Zn-dependent protease
VEVEFYANSSWVKAGRKSAELLSHEQGHFDITELYARRMRRAIRDAKIGCEDDRRAEAAGKRIFGELDREWEKAEKQYDADTKDGTDGLREKEAVERIARELAELGGYVR